MKELICIAKESATNRDGFLNGMFKGALVSATIIIVFAFMTGWVG